jgi:putative exosortase-associated protein (TIGR04073 family)
MKLLLVTLLGAGFALTSLADIQEPPAADHGPTRKLGRGLSNMLYGWAEIPVTIGRINTNEGNAAAASYGVVRGTGRAFARFGAGLYEALLWPIPVYQRTYFPILRSDIPWVHRGYGEFPPELGNESKYPYVRSY